MLKILHCLISNCEFTIESLLSFEGIKLFVLCRKGKFLICLFVVFVGNNSGEGLVVLLWELKIMFLPDERPPSQTLISGPMFSEIG